LIQCCLYRLIDLMNGGSTLLLLGSSSLKGSRRHLILAAIKFRAGNLLISSSSRRIMQRSPVRHMRYKDEQVIKWAEHCLPVGARRNCCRSSGWVFFFLPPLDEEMAAGKCVSIFGTPWERATIKEGSKTLAPSAASNDKSQRPASNLQSQFGGKYGRPETLYDTPV
jgi:hypothetical protein